MNAPASQTSPCPASEQPQANISSQSGTSSQGDSSPLNATRGAPAAAGLAAGASALLNVPIALSVDPQGNVTVSASGNGPDGLNGLNGQGTDSVREILKPGYRTTEFWLVAWIVGLTLLEALFGQLPASRATLLSACIGGGYSLCRSGLKALRYIQSADADQTRAAMESESAHREHQLALEKLK